MRLGRCSQSKLGDSLRSGTGFAARLLYSCTSSRRPRLQLPLSPPSRMDETHVVTCFLRNRGEVLLLRRSEEVGSYSGKWGGVAGHAEGDPDALAREEIEEETGLLSSCTFVRAGDPFDVDDDSLDKRWVVHPYLFDCTSRDCDRRLGDDRDGVGPADRTPSPRDGAGPVDLLRPRRADGGIRRRGYRTRVRVHLGPGARSPPRPGRMLRGSRRRLGRIGPPRATSSTPGRAWPRWRTA